MEDGAIIDLNVRVPDGSSWLLDRATAVAGEMIVGNGHHRGQLRAFMMRPAAPADINADGVVDVNDLIAVLGSWGPCSGCVADINGDGVVGIDDLLLVLSGWS